MAFSMAPSLWVGELECQTARPRREQHGPAVARVVYIWKHGKTNAWTDSRGERPQPNVRALSNSGYDVVRFDQAPTTDAVTTAELWLREGIAELRRRGWSV
jgi:hypothetical protein